eukprot:PhM_4_TR17456/c2_g3_i2/m.36628
MSIGSLQVAANVTFHIQAAHSVLAYFIVVIIFGERTRSNSATVSMALNLFVWRWKWRWKTTPCEGIMLSERVFLNLMPSKHELPREIAPSANTQLRLRELSRPLSDI